MRSTFLVSALVIGGVLTLFGGYARASASSYQCDLLAGSVQDASRPLGVLGVSFGVMDGKAASVACKRALDEEPANQRLKFQLARALQRDGQPPAAYLPLYAEAGQSGYGVALYFLAVSYLTGLGGTPVDLAKGADWMRKAATSGSSAGMRGLGIVLESGQGTAKNLSQANGWYRKAAEAGDNDSKLRLAFNLLSGIGVKQNHREAVRWYRNAADAGNPQAMRVLGQMIERGLGGTKDPVQANFLYRKAADAGDWQAMLYLATNLVSGSGIAQNDAEAAGWYRKAAIASSPSAVSAMRAVIEQDRKAAKGNKGQSL